MVSPYFPIEEYESRWGRVHAEMKRRGFDAAVVWGRSAGGFERCALQAIPQKRDRQCVHCPRLVRCQQIALQIDVAAVA